MVNRLMPMAMALLTMPLVSLLPLPALAASFGIPELDEAEGRVIRSSSQATYTWDHVDTGGRSHRMVVTTSEGSRWFDKVQKRYATLNHDTGSYLKYLRYDPYEAALESWATRLKQKARENGFSDIALVLSFVQSISYQDVSGYQRFPYETLIDWAGDCSDTTVLFAALMDAMGYDWVLLQYSADNHVAVGVWLDEDFAERQNDGNGATYYKHEGRKYYFAETTGYGFRLGQKPDGLRRTATIIDSYKSRARTGAPSRTTTFNVRSIYPYKLWIEFCSAKQSPYSYHWPENDKLWVLGDGEWHTYRLSCAAGDTICYGVMNSTNPAKADAFWGAGVDCSMDCDDCCVTCGGSTSVTLE